MDLDFYTRIGLLLAGVLLLVFFNVDWVYMLSRLVFWKTPQNKNKDFLNMINLWYQLKTMCDTNNYVEASEKLNEVFPLLNKDRE